MTQNISENQIESNVNEEQETTVITPKKPAVGHTMTREERINAYVEGSAKFNKDTSRTIEILPNVGISVLFFEDWYLDWDDLFHEAKIVKKLDDGGALKYADTNYRVKKTLKDSTNEVGKQYSQHTFLVTDPNSPFPDMVKELNLTSKKAIDTLNEELKRVSLEHEGKIIVDIYKKQGKTQFQVEWKIEARPFTP